MRKTSTYGARTFAAWRGCGEGQFLALGSEQIMLPTPGHRAIDGGGLFGLAWHPTRAARSTREKLAEIHCEIGWRGQRRDVAAGGARVSYAFALVDGVVGAGWRRWLPLRFDKDVAKRSTGTLPVEAVYRHVSPALSR